MNDKTYAQILQFNITNIVFKVLSWKIWCDEKHGKKIKSRTKTSAKSGMGEMSSGYQSSKSHKLQLTFRFDV